MKTLIAEKFGEIISKYELTLGDIQFIDDLCEKVYTIRKSGIAACLMSNATYNDEVIIAAECMRRAAETRYFRRKLPAL